MLRGIVPFLANSRPTHMPPEKSATHNRREGSIGLIGLGLVGSALAKRLLSAGFQVHGWDINPNQWQAAAQAGVGIASNALELWQAAERIVLSLPDDSVVSDVVYAQRQHWRAGQCIIDTSTGSPESAGALGKELARAQIEFLEATISGSSAQVESGEVLVMAGGPEATFARCEDVLRAFARRAVLVGPWGASSKMKLVTNLVLGLNRAALAEGLVLGSALGLDPEQILTLLRESMAYSRIMDTKGAKMLRRDFSTQARLSQHLKDVRLMIESAARHHTMLPLTEAHRQLLEKAETLGLGEMDNSAILRAIEACSQITS
jgi:3-hydroxyisobutyrate dehydrogenase-like beta-hydroxyacid dehydrogenase